MSTSLEDPRFGRFVRTDTSLREAWRGQWDTLALHLDQPEAAELLRSLPPSLARFLDEAKHRVAAELLAHGNARWSAMTSARLAAALTPVALGALHASGRITLAFEEGWPVLSDVSAELTPEGIPTLVGYTARTSVALKPERRATHQVEGWGEVHEEDDAGETRYAVKQGAVTIRFNTLDEVDAVRRVQSELERIAKEAALFAATLLAPEWNASWRDEGERTMSAEAMAAEFTLAEIDMYEESGFDVTMHDGGLFAEHLIVVSHDGTQWAHAGLEG